MGYARLKTVVYKLLITLVVSTAINLNYMPPVGK